MNKWFLILLGLLLSGQSPALIVPLDRRVTWQGNVGVSGGIPARTTIYTNLPLGVTVTDVHNALVACPASNVVQLTNGSYTFAGNLDWQGTANGVVLRGTTNLLGHATNTHITFTSGQILWRGSDPYDLNAMSNVTALTALPLAGDTSITVGASPAWLKVGELYLIHQLENSNFVSLNGIEDTSIGNSECRWCQTLSERRSAAQTVKVTSITGTGPFTVNLDLPLIWGWETNLAAEIGCTSYAAASFTHKQGWGLEDLEIEGGYSASQQHMMVSDAIENGWIKNCFFYNTPGGTHTMFYFCYRISVVDSRFDTAHSYAAGQGYGVGFNYGTSYGLCQNNIFKDLHIHMSSSYGGGGHVFAYNASFGSGSDGNQYVAIGTHGAHTLMNLWEGNYAEDKVFLDYIHGSSSHQTFLRNYLIGFHSGQGAGLTYAVGNDYFNRSNNFVGNIFGSKAQMGHKEDFAPSGSDGGVWELGFNSSSSFSLTTNVTADAVTDRITIAFRLPTDFEVAFTGTTPPGGLSFTPTHYFVNSPTATDFKVAATVGGAPIDVTSAGTAVKMYLFDTSTNSNWLRHGNLSLYNNTSDLNWDAGIADQTIPDSYYLPAKPAWFADRPWPIFTSNSVLSTVYTNIPAGFLYAFGTNAVLGALNSDHKPLRVKGPNIVTGHK